MFNLDVMVDTSLKETTSTSITGSNNNYQDMFLF